MQINVVSGDITKTESQCVVINLFEGVTAPGGGTGAIDRALSGMISELIGSGDVRGKWGELTLVHTFGKIPAPRVLIAGLGKSSEFTIDRVRDLSASVAKYLRGRRIEQFATITHGAGIAGLDPEACAQAIAEGATLGLYRFDRHKKSDEDATEISSMTIVEHEAAKVPALQRAAERGAIVAEAANFARDLANEPSNVLTPSELAARAEAAAREHGLGCHIYDRAWAEEMGMGSFLGVAKGSAQPPKFIVLTYQGAGEARPLGLIGKGITFDTGGISIKPAAGMEEMKGDMSGAAAVIGVLKAVAVLKPDVSVIGVIPATENMPGGGAQKPGDIWKSLAGPTVEVINTDAEGRLVLGDALTYAERQGAKTIIDLATLTGGVRVALGDLYSGILGNDKKLQDALIQAGRQAGERYWPFPMDEAYEDYLKSDVADLMNCTEHGKASPIQGGIFLKRFVKDAAWAHLDIAGTFLNDRDLGPTGRGPTGVGVRTVLTYLTS